MVLKYKDPTAHAEIVAIREVLTNNKQETTTIKVYLNIYGLFSGGKHTGMQETQGNQAI